MSDDPIKPSDPPAAAPAGLYEHYCERPGCTKWGGWGFGKVKSEPPRWFCFAHREDGERYL